MAQPAGRRSLCRRRVVVTGLGIVSPMGSTVASAWDGIVNGRSGIRTITKLDVSAFPVRIGGEVVGFNAEEYMSLKDIRKFDPFVPFGFASAVQAVKDSGIQVTEENSPRIGVAIGAGIGGLSHYRGEHREVARGEVAAQDFSVLHPRQHHQRGGRPGIDSFRDAWPQPRTGHGLHDLDAFDRHRRALHPVRGCRHDGRRRRRDGVHAARPRQLSARPRRFRCATTNRSARAGRGTATVTAS